jgi:hypothetical protein
MGESLTWLGIFFCISQSAIFSGLNLAFFSLTRLRLEIEAEMSGSKGANKVLQMRKDSNFLLTTILWGNVGINVLLTLLSNSVMTGLVSFTFSTFIITIFGEIVPQAYFSRNALKMASLLAPVLRLYQFLLYPVAKPCALLLDSWLGKETKQFFSEENIKMFLAKHIEEDDSEIDKMEGLGAINFLTLDDTLVIDEGEDINQDSIVQLRSENGKLIFPEYSPTVSDPFIQRINRSDEKWIIFTDETNTPKLVIDADGFIRSMSMHPASSMENIYKYTHTPIVVRKNAMNLGELVLLLKNNDNTHSDHPIKRDIAILWNEKYKKIITGADLFGRLLKGI